jgi:hypothetical protein
MGCPFLKRELLRDNPVRIPGLVSWQEVIQSATKYDTDLIAASRAYPAPPSRLKPATQAFRQAWLSSNSAGLVSRE